jgi:putative transposase
MAIPKRSSQPGTFFVTSATYNRRRLFQVGSNAELFIATLQEYRHAGHNKLHAFVVMPDHFHILLTPQEITLERCLGLIKGGFSHKMGSKFPIWQRGFTDHRIRNREEFLTRLNYIHQNPVDERIVECAELYPHSSAYRPVEAKRTSAAEAGI